MSFLLSLGITYYTQDLSRHFKWEGLSFKLLTQSSHTATFKDPYNVPLTITIAPDQLNDYLYLMTLTYGDTTITYDSRDFEKDAVITTSDGKIYTEPIFSISFTHSAETKPSEVQLINSARFTISNAITFGNFMLFMMLNSLLIIIGWSNVIYPEWGWCLRHALSVDGGQPSDFYLAMSKWGGYITVLIGLGLPLFVYFSTRP